MERSSNNNSYSFLHYASPHKHHEHLAPKNLKEFVKQRTQEAHYGTPSDYIRGLIREDLKQLEQERLEQELLKGLRSGKGIPMTTQAWKRLSVSNRVVDYTGMLSPSSVLPSPQPWAILESAPASCPSAYFSPYLQNLTHQRSNLTCCQALRLCFKHGGYHR